MTRRRCLRVGYHAVLAVLTLLLTEAVIRTIRPQEQLVRKYIGMDAELGPVSKPYARYCDTKGGDRWGA